MIETQQQRSNTLSSEGRNIAASRERDRLRVLHVISFLGCGGTEHGVMKVILGLDADRFEHRICVTRGFDPDFARQFDMQGRVLMAGSAAPTLQFPLFRLARIIQSYKPHVVHSRNWGALEAVPAARLAKVPAVVHSEHGYEIGGLAGLPRRQRIFRRVAYSMTDAVFTVTEDLRDYHARQAGVAVERIRVIANGVDTVRFAPHPEKRLRVRRDLGIPPDAFVAGSVGRLVKIKGHDTLLNAVQQRRATGSEAWVLLVGAGPELERLQQIANGPLLAGRVVFAGASDQVSDLLNAMDVFALPSLGEGFSNTLLEAMACGLPSLATCVGGNSEVMGREGLRWQFAPGDFEELAKHLEVLERDAGLRKAVGLFARERAVTRFNLDLMMNSYCNLYTSITERRGVRLRGEA